MNDVDFAREVAILVSKCSPAQRKTLADFATSYGKPSEAEGAEQAGDRRLMAADGGTAGKSIVEVFPGLKRLHGAA